MTLIIGVHGAGNRQSSPPKEAAQALSMAWYRRLSANIAGLKHEDIHVAYYAHQLNAPIAQEAGDLISLPSQVQAAILNWAVAMGLPQDPPEGWLTWPIVQAVEWVAELFGTTYERLASGFVQRFFSEVETYLNSPSQRCRAQDAVAEIVRAEAPSIVIAHSLGSIVAYEALHRFPDLHVDMFLTLGSPLGLPRVVFERLLPRPANLGSRPPGVRRWLNIADHGDVVAIPRPLSRCFDLDEDRHTSIHFFDFHTVRSYLASDAVSSALRPYIQAKPGNNRERGGGNE